MGRGSGPAKKGDNDQHRFRPPDDTKIQNRNGIFYQGVGMKCEGFVNSFISTEKNNDVFHPVERLTRDNIENTSQHFTTLNHS